MLNFQSLIRSDPLLHALFDTFQYQTFFQNQLYKFRFSVLLGRVDRISKQLHLI